MTIGAVVDPFGQAAAAAASAAAAGQSLAEARNSAWGRRLPLGSPESRHARGHERPHLGPKAHFAASDREPAGGRMQTLIGAPG